MAKRNENMVRGHDLVEQGKFKQGIAAFYNAICQEPNATQPKCAYLYSKQRIADFDKSSREQMTLLKGLILDGKAAPPFTVFCLTDDPHVQLASAVNTGIDLAVDIPQYTDWKPASGKIKIGYISSYFRRHALSVLIAEVLRLHNRDLFEIYVFAFGDAKEDSDDRKRIKEMCDHFVNLKGINDADSAVLIRDLGINILFDMNGYSGHIRPGIMARKPAPVNALWMSYPTTTGAPWSDYYISDKYIVETPEHEKSFVERVKRLSRCCWTYDTTGRGFDFNYERTPAITDRPPGTVVLANVNGTHKQSFLSLTMWFTIMEKAPNTILWSFDTTDIAIKNMKTMANKMYGIDPRRIIQMKSIQHAKHLARFSEIDLVLDSFPCNGHTLSMDSLWAGCPMVTMAGATPISRVASSALRTQGFDYLVTHTPEEYISKALELINNEDYRHSIRQLAQERRESGLLFDQRSMVKELDSIYVEMWEESKDRMGL